jgi:hypothetical protein
MWKKTLSRGAVPLSLKDKFNYKEIEIVIKNGKKILDLFISTYISDRRISIRTMLVCIDINIFINT